MSLQRTRRHLQLITRINTRYVVKYVGDGRLKIAISTTTMAMRSNIVADIESQILISRNVL